MTYFHKILPLGYYIRLLTNRTWFVPLSTGVAKIMCCRRQTWSYFQASHSIDRGSMCLCVLGRTPQMLPCTYTPTTEPSKLFSKINTQETLRKCKFKFMSIQNCLGFIINGVLHLSASPWLINDISYDRDFNNESSVSSPVLCWILKQRVYRI